MSHTRTLRTSLLSALLVAGCGQAPASTDGARALRLQLAEGGLQVMSPSRLSLGFTVETEGGEPVAGLTSAAFDIYEDGLAVSHYESQRSIQPRAHRSRMYSLVLLDLSGSILRAGELPRLREAALAYVTRIISEGGEAQRVGLAGFDGRGTLRTLVDFTGDLSALQAGLGSLGQAECTVNADCAGHVDARTCAGGLCVDDSTNLNGAVISGLGALDAAVKADTAIPFRQGALVVFTDGTDQAARVDAKATREAVQQSPLHVFTVGLGGEADEAALRDFGKDGYEPVAEMTDLSTAFDAIARRVAAMANRFYVLDYCSPKRHGTHALRVVASFKDGSGVTLSGALEQTFDATGFSSGCEIPQEAGTTP
ncbi:MAG: hypothetical protein RL653_2139 [Pseudomonadota bacterium]